MGYHVAHAGEHEFVERPNVEGEAPRLAADITSSAQLQRSRARVWRYPPHTRGRRHADHVQEEVFVVLSGTLTMLLGEPPERVDLNAGDLVVVHIGTPMQARNESDAEAVFFAYGAPPVTGQAEFLDDVESI